MASYLSSLYLETDEAAESKEDASDGLGDPATGGKEKRRPNDGQAQNPPINPMSVFEPVDTLKLLQCHPSIVSTEDKT